MSFHSEGQLLQTLRSLGVRFLDSQAIDLLAPTLSPASLLTVLSGHPEARFRLAIIPLLLYRPDLATVVEQTALELKGPARTRLELFYTSAMLLQQEHSKRLEALLGTRLPLPDLFSSDLGLAMNGDPRTCLNRVAELHRALTGLSINWLGTYEHAAERFIKRLEHEAEWARLEQAK